MNERLQNIQADLKGSAEKVWLAGLGALTLAGEEGNKIFSNLVEKGKELDGKESGPSESAKKTFDSAKERAGDLWERVEGSFNDKVAIALQKLGVPTREEIQQLTERVETLMTALEKLNTEPTEAAEKK